MSVDVLTHLSATALRDLDMMPRATVSVPRRERPGAVMFFRGEDDLDRFEAAALCVEQKSDDWHVGHIAKFATELETWSPTVAERRLSFMLFRYDREPAEQLTIFLPGDVQGQHDVDRAIKRITAALNLTPDARVNVLPVQPPKQ